VGRLPFLFVFDLHFHAPLAFPCVLCVLLGLNGTSIAFPCFLVLALAAKDFEPKPAFQHAKQHVLFFIG
jgi:hypothetical protein